jgi:hypothetical protein
MIIRNYVPGDADCEAGVFNAAAARLPGFRPVTGETIRRVAAGPGFDPATRLYAEADGKVVGCAQFEPTGRVYYPWCKPGYEHLRHQLFAAMMRALADRKVPRAFAAVRADWDEPLEYFADHGFEHARDAVNFTQSLGDLPTMFQRPGLNVTRVRPDDLLAIEAMVPGLPRLQGQFLADYLLRNPNLAADAVYVLRQKDGTPQGVGLLIDDATFTDVAEFDPRAAAFWAGAFGFDGLAGPKVNGLFSFLTAPGKDAVLVGQDLLWYGTARLETSTFPALAAQVPSDAPHLLRFYERYFQKRGSFPILERDVGTGSKF